MMISKMKKNCLLTAILILVTGTAIADKSHKATIEDPDVRIKLSLPPDERHMVLLEMRNFVVAMQIILDGLAKDDMAKVSVAAKAMGSGAANEIPPRVVAKLPDDFKMLAGKVHTTFDAISLDAEQLGFAEHTISQMADLTQHCIACHGMYQVDRER